MSRNKRAERKRRAKLRAEVGRRLKAELESERETLHEVVLGRLETEKVQLFEQYGRRDRASRKITTRTWARVTDSTPMSAIYHERFAEILEEVKNEKRAIKSTD